MLKPLNKLLKIIKHFIHIKIFPFWFLFSYNYRFVYEHFKCICSKRIWFIKNIYLYLYVVLKCLCELELGLNTIIKEIQLVVYIDCICVFLCHMYRFLISTVLQVCALRVFTVFNTVYSFMYRTLANTIINRFGLGLRHAHEV